MVIVVIVVIVEVDGLLIVLSRLDLASVTLLPEGKVQVVAFDADPILRTVRGDLLGGL
jgi:hypothetical protein